MHFIAYDIRYIQKHMGPLLLIWINFNAGLDN